MTVQETHEFKAEIKKLLDIISKSLYKHKEIFLRELVSNATDALKKIHFISLQNKDILNPDAPLEITIIIDNENKRLIVKDTGVGMTREDLINNLGTIAGSGSEKFLKQIQELQEKSESKEIDLDIIGQFGVGFYSVFMVAKKVTVITKSYLKEEPAYKWESSGAGEFKISEADKKDRGTEVIIEFQSDEQEYLDRYRIESIIKKYSNFIPYPIYLEEIKKEEEKKEEEKEKEKETGDKTEKEEKGEKEEGKETKREPINEIEPLWKKMPSDIKEEQYREFYHFISKRFDDYSHIINYSVDGKVQFHSILYIPSTSTQDMFHPELDYGPALYSKNVMIMENCKELVPQWMRFVKGVVDTEDLPLNVSREVIQNNRTMMKITDLLVKKLINELVKLAKKDKEKYMKIWDQFSDFIKEGIITDRKYKEKLIKLLRFPTSKTKDDELISLDEYVKRVKKDQEEIYYLVGGNLQTMRLSPHLDYYNKEDLEVLLLSEPIDNFLMMNLFEYTTTIGEGDDAEEKTFKFVPIDTAEQKEDSEDKEKEKDKNKSEISKKHEKYLQHIKSLLGNKIIDAKMSNKLYGNACRLATPSGGMTSSMERAMRYWTQTTSKNDFEIPKRVFEFNPDHPTIKGLVELYDSDPDNGKIDPVIQQLFENCLLAEGDLPNPSLMVPRINQLIEMLITGNDNVEAPSIGEMKHDAKENEETHNEEKESKEKENTKVDESTNTIDDNQDKNEKSEN
ncbi:MAG: molecular chaperone HtpG [Promethearchaeota archaeon]